jgi:hypothetical protein
MNNLPPKINGQIRRSILSGTEGETYLPFLIREEVAARLLPALQDLQRLLVLLEFLSHFLVPETQVGEFFASRLLLVVGLLAFPQT